MRPFVLAATSSILVLAAACGANGEAQQAAAPGAPVETQPANTTLRPAFAGQTRAPGVATTGRIVSATVASGLEHPWGMAQLPDGNWLITERPGRMRIVTAQGAVGEPIAGVPPVVARGQGGLLDVILSPGFATDRTIFWSYSEPRTGGNATSVARGVLSADGRALSDVRVIFRSLPAYDGDKHFGSALAFAPDGKLFITLGERSDAVMRPQAQDLGSHLGKIIRINADGTVPQDNPFVGQAGALPEIWSLGHRSPQGIAIQPGTGAVWNLEHGPRGGDELNHVEPGKNYGWPTITYGIEYGGAVIGDNISAREGLEQPVYYWDPVIAPGGAAFYTGSMFPAWQGNLLVAGLAGKSLTRLVLEGDRVVGEERLLTSLNERIRDVAVGADGAVWIITDEQDGKLVRVTLAN